MVVGAILGAFVGPMLDFCFGSYAAFQNKHSSSNTLSHVMTINSFEVCDWRAIALRFVYVYLHSLTARFRVHSASPVLLCVSLSGSLWVTFGGFSRLFAQKATDIFQNSLSVESDKHSLWNRRSIPSRPSRNGYSASRTGSGG